jgi:hypothetical protein
MRNLMYNRKGQSIFEYFILSILVVSIGLFFLNTSNYRAVNATAEGFFNKSVSKIAGN